MVIKLPVGPFVSNKTISDMPRWKYDVVNDLFVKQDYVVKSLWNTYDLEKILISDSMLTVESLAASRY